MDTSLSLIVTATDFSSGSRAAVRAAVDLAARTEAAVHLVHVRDAGSGALHDFDRVGGPERYLRTWAERALEAASLAEAPFEVVILEDNDSARALLQYVDEQDADLLVAGTHGRRGVPRLLLGSVAERLVRFCPCPVLTVPYRSSPLRPGRLAPVLAPVDFSFATPGVLAWAKRLAALYGARLDLLHVVVEPPPTPKFYSSRPPEDTRPTGRLDRRAGEELAQAANQAPGPHVELRTHVRRGVPSREIAEFALEQETGLIVMDTQGLTGLENLLLGSTAEKTLRLAPCPVLTLRRARVEDPTTGDTVGRAALASA